MERPLQSPYSSRQTYRVLCSALGRLSKPIICINLTFETEQLASLRTFNFREPGRHHDTGVLGFENPSICPVDLLENRGPVHDWDALDSRARGGGSPWKVRWLHFSEYPSMAVCRGFLWRGDRGRLYTHRPSYCLLNATIQRTSHSFAWAKTCARFRLNLRSSIFFFSPLHSTRRHVSSRVFLSERGPSH